MHSKLPKLRAARLLLAVSTCLLALPAYSQSSKGVIEGTVVDAVGGKMTNTAITLVSPTTGVTVTVMTNSDGIYRFEAVQPGDYVVSVKQTGFTNAEQTATVVVGAVVGRDFTLHAGSTDVVEVQADKAAELQTEDAVRGGTISTTALIELPIAGQNSLNLLLTVPGVARTNTGSNDTSGVGSVNGARGRSNNFLIDGLQNNDISIGGPQFTIMNNDELQEVNFQTSNFTAEYGRAGGAVVNQVTKSGSNRIHGTLFELYRSEVFNASTNTQRINFNNGSTAVLKNVFHDNNPNFTIGGPVYIPHLYNGHDKTFFFGAGQWDRYSANNAGTTFVVPTAAGVATLAALAPSCPNVAAYLANLGSVTGSTGIGVASIDISVPANLANTTCNGTARTGQSVQVGNYVRTAPEISTDNNHLIRVDHVASDRQNMMFRWLYDQTADNIGGTVGINNLFDVPFTGRTMAANFNHTYSLSPRLLNEFRFGFIRNSYTFFNGPGISNTLPTFSVPGLTTLALSSTFPQGRIANSFQYEDAVSYIHGKHALKFGVEILRQLATQQAPYNSRGAYTYTTSTSSAATAAYLPTTIQGLANFIDNYAGPTGAATISLGSGRYHPNLFVWTLYAQDIWKATPDLSVTYGLRYENFGQPANIFKYPAEVGTADTDITNTARVSTAKHNFGPTLGFSYNPHVTSKGIGSGSTVIRGGFQITYDTQFNNILSNLVAGLPNTIGNSTVVTTTSATTPRGYGNLTAFPFTAAPVTPYSSEVNKVGKNFRNPYYYHYSLGFQQQMVGKIVADISYVGSLGRQEYINTNLNPALPNATFSGTATQATPLYGTQTLRLYPNRGSIMYRDNGATSNYNSLQVQIRRKTLQTMLGGFTFSESYTYSKNLDIIGDVFATYGSQSSYPSRSPSIAGPLINYDYGPADTDLRHISSTVVQWQLPGVKNGFLNRLVGGWSLTPILLVTSGQPYTILNGVDRDLDGISLGDRPDVSNVNAPVNTRGLVTSSANCATGYYNGNATISSTNPVSANCVSPGAVHFLQVTSYSPTSPVMERRNSNLTTRYLDLDTDILKKIAINERFRVELRGEFFNVTNNQNFTTPSAPVNVSTANGTNFQNFLLNNGGSRTFRVAGKIIF